MGLIDLGVRYRGQAMDTMGGIARRETERVNFNRKLAAQEKAGRWNAAGQGLGLGYMGYQTGALGKAAETVGASPGVVDFLTPAKTGAETAAANAAQQGGNAIQATRALNTPGVPSGYAPDPGSLSNVPMPGSGAPPASVPTTTAPAPSPSAATAAPTTSPIIGAPSGGEIGTTVGKGVADTFGLSSASAANVTGAGTVGGQLGGTIGGGVGQAAASPLSLASAGLNAIGDATGISAIGGGVGTAAGGTTGTGAAGLLGSAGGAIVEGAAAAGAAAGSALSSLGALILAF